ncbi:hypothetical protein SAMN05660649_01973 [Desulfotomaculum arcticum]|uniref:DUF2292 domain-containing protein n=1 Tax=Desulfotruncus arcticus DSM 17038 TaxID=1121424 RepID=A0A1I2SSA0_9FIRM|nr:DUF2292 domain-containing protein [Desulfotruncus arcticus]SFG55558.1 hypothetical protein SAMN05660649_01973 [Desulfotomaculum arcticum] [Desulfotruncus arcticus DSM 17038]
MPPDNDKRKMLTNREKQLIRFIRQLKWGEVKIKVENGQPVLIYEAIKTLKLGDSDTTHPSKVW